MTRRSGSHYLQESHLFSTQMGVGMKIFCYMEAMSNFSDYIRNFLSCWNNEA